MAADVSQEDLSQSQILERSRSLTQSYRYLAALEVLDTGLSLYPDNEDMTAEFKKNTELYIVHEISSGYRRIDKNPQDVEAYLSISKAFLLMDDKFKALEVLTEGTFVNQSSVALWRQIAQLETLSGRLQEANSALREAERYDSSH